MGERATVPPSARHEFGVAWLEPGIALGKPPRESREESVRAYYEAFDALLTDHVGPHVIITDTTGLRSIPDARQRRLHAEITNAMLEEGRHECVLNVVLVHSPILRGALRAYLWLVRNPIPTESVGSMEVALERSRAALQKATSPSPPTDFRPSGPPA